MKNPKGIWKKAFVLTLAGGVAFWLVGGERLGQQIARSATCTGRILGRAGA